MRTTETIDDYDLVAFRDNAEHLGSRVGDRLIEHLVELSPSTGAVRPFLFPAVQRKIYFNRHIRRRHRTAKRDLKMPDEQVLAWLKAKARVADAEEQLSDMLDKAETLLRSLRDQPSTPFDPKSWPESSAVAAALQECREAQRAFDKANAVLSPADRKLLKSIPADF
jgi:hypothetical protein